MNVLWASCKCDREGNLLASMNVKQVTEVSRGVYEAQLANELGPNECSSAAFPWYVTPDDVPLVQFVCGVESKRPNIIIVNGFAGSPPEPSSGAFDLVVWRFVP